MLRCGADALLVELDGPGQVAAAAAQLAEARAAGRLGEVVELVPAARTVLVAVRPGTGLDAVRAGIAALRPEEAAPAPGRRVVIPVVYDGADLDLVARTAGLPSEEVVALHTGATYTVAFCGFAPGFGYLTGLPEPLRQPRLDTPRARILTGSVGLAGEYTGVYPRTSPGGWRLLGHTEEVLFDPRRDPPALLAPGDEVRFEALP